MYGHSPGVAHSYLFCVDHGVPVESGHGHGMKSTCTSYDFHPMYISFTEFTGSLEVEWSETLIQLSKKIIIISRRKNEFFFL